MKSIFNKYLTKFLNKRGYMIVKKQSLTPHKEVVEREVFSNYIPVKRPNKDIIKYIHIGYPKCASTSLQLDYFGRHPQLYHLGSGCNNYSIGYIDDEITVAVERDLRFSRDFAYDEEKIKSVFNKHFTIAQENPNYYATGISCEHFSFNYLNDIDTGTKAKRLFSIFGPTTKIIMVVRNQKDLLEALYKEHIRQGYSGTYNDFLTYTFHHKYKSWLTDFRFDLLYKSYAGFFGNENVLVVPFELLKENPKEFLKSISNHLGVNSDLLTEIADNNVRLSSGAIEMKRQLNKRCLHGVEQSIFSPSHLNRFSQEFTTIEKQDVLKSAVIDHELKEALTSLSIKLASKGVVADIDLSYSRYFDELFAKEFNKGNEFIQGKTRYSLKNYSF